MGCGPYILYLFKFGGKGRHCQTVARQQLTATPADSSQQLISQVFPNIQWRYQNLDWLRERAILAPRNRTVTDINRELLQQLPGTERTYTATNTALNDTDALHYPIEFLNFLEPSGLPTHELHLKTGAPIILLRNLDQPRL